MPEAMPGAGAPAAEQAGTAQPEIASAAPERMAAPASVPPLTTAVDPLAVQQIPPATKDVTSTTPLATPVNADDKDVVEKEWVIKAKEIIASTKEDPYRQSHDMAAFRADYLQKRYNKAIKLAE